MKKKKICVFCGSREEVSVEFKDLATRCGEMIVEKDMVLIYGGSNTGLMARVSSAVNKAGGKVIGVYPKLLDEKEPLSAEISDPIMVDSLAVRKEIMMINADAFLILPGGVGTLDEAFEILTLKVLGYNKPVVFLNHNGYWDKFQELCEHIVQNKFATHKLFDAYRMANNLEEAFEKMGF
jgi:uncharacterized protein (TIGR00730 family)